MNWLVFILGWVTLAAATAAKADCRMFEHKDFLGESVVLTNNQSMGNLGALNDRVSSIRVAPQCLLVAYADAQYVGATTTFGPGGHTSLPDGWDDQISSARCNCR